MYIAMKDLQFNRLLVIYPGPYSYPLADNIQTVPLKILAAFWTESCNLKEMDSLTCELCSAPRRTSTLASEKPPKLSPSTKDAPWLFNGRRGVTPNTALRLAKYFGNTAAFWMNLQLRRDLYFADQAEKQVLKKISPHQVHLAGD